MPFPKERETSIPTFQEEIALWGKGFRCIAGIDEVGRGPLAGPLVAAAVVLYPPLPAWEWVQAVRDSKLLLPARREELAQLIQAHAAVAIGVVSHETIDAEGLTAATRRAMYLAVTGLPVSPDFLLVDGRERLRMTIRQKSIIDGDRLVVSIAAASIVAKVHRDRRMEELEAQYPGWGLGRHKGYGTRAHLEALRHLGPSPVHRRSFAPLKALESAATVGGVALASEEAQQMSLLL